MSSTEILDVDVAAFERGGRGARSAVIDGVRTSLASGFVYTSHTLSEDLLDTAYGMLAQFFALPTERKEQWRAPHTHGQTGYTGLAVETAVGADQADWKEMLNWGVALPAGHPLRVRYPHRYPDQRLPEADVPGITSVLGAFYDGVLALQAKVLRILAIGLGCDEAFFDDLLEDGSHLARAIHYPVMTGGAPGAMWAGPHADINLITALPRASGPGLQIQQGDAWIDVIPPSGHVVINAGIMLERLTNARIPARRHQVVAAAGAVERYSVVQFCHPAPWFHLEPISSCIDAAHPRRYGTIEAGALLDRVIYDLGLVRD